MGRLHLAFFVFFFTPTHMGKIRTVGKIKISVPNENHGFLYLVCKVLTVTQELNCSLWWRHFEKLEKLINSFLNSKYIYFKIKKHTQLTVYYIIKIFNGCEVLIEKFRQEGNFSASRGLPSDAERLPEWRNFLFAAKNIYGFFFLHTLPSTIAFRLEYV